MTGGRHAARGLRRELRRLLALTTALSVAPVLGGLVMLVPPAFAIPCTGALNTANSTTCANGVDGAGLVYVADNPLYVDGDFTLRLDNHDVVTSFGNAIGFTGVTAGNDGTITLENGSDLDSGPGSAGISSNAVGSSTTINIRTGSSVNGVIAILAMSDGGDITLNTDADTVVTGALGITTIVAGAGNVLIDAQGTVTAFGAAGTGISASTAQGTVEVKTGSGAITAGATGINAQATLNTVKVTTGTGAVSGTNGAGINATGTTSVTVTTGGDVTGGGAEGIRAFALNGNVNVTTGVNSTVTGLGNDGIGAFASNSGNVVVKAQGIVTGSVSGIDAEAAGANGTIMITTTAAVTGLGAEGIDASAASNVTVEAGGDVTGTSAGINAVAFIGDVRVTTAAATTVLGTSGNGITANASFAGNVVVLAESAVTGDSRGIDAHAESGTVDITTGTAAVSGAEFGGIEASASGNVTVKAGGDVSGGTNGISAETTGPGNILVETAAGALIRGGLGSGIGAGTAATSLITITNNADTRGNVAGIQATSGTGAIQIDNTGVVANLSGNSFDLAIQTAGGASTVNNSNILIGTVSLGDLGDTINNIGLWKTGGVSNFGTGFDVVNNSGTLLVAHDALVPENTMFANFQTLNNSGLVSLVDGKEGDDFFITGEGGSQYVGQGGRLAVDAFLAEGGTADTLSVGGNTSGVTHLVVNLTNPVGSTPNFDGITVVQVLGNTAQGDFVLEGGVLNAGFFAWDVKSNGSQQKLFTTGLGAGSFEFAAGITGAQDIWHQSTGTVLQRQADLRSLLAGTQVTPVADFSEPVEPTPVGHVTPGLWFKGVGGYLERDANEGVLVLDRDQTIFGFLAGFDFGTENLHDQGDALMFGLFGGYLTSDLNFDSTNSEWNYEGPSVGVYATYLNHAFYADATIKADFLDVDIDADDLAPGEGDADTDVLNIGGQIDTGYKVPLDRGLFVEPQASLAVVHTEVDDIDDIFGGAVEFDDETSVRGRLGLRLGHELTASNRIIYSSDVMASVWQEFAGDNNATVFAPDFPVTGVSDDPGETFGDVSIGFSAQSPEGWSSFLRGNYQFADDYDAFAGNAGVRYAW